MTTTAKTERSQKVAAIERKVKKTYKAIAVLEDLDSKKFADTITALQKEVEILENAAIAILKQNFADLKKG